MTVTDTITGLVWQRDRLGARPGCGKDPACTGTEAQAYCASLVLGGLSGWRLPGWMELLTLLDLRTSIPTTDREVFPDGLWICWTSSLSNFVGVRLYVDFSEGTSGYCSNDMSNFVLCVRGSRCYPTTRFLVLDGGLVRDALTGLVWQQQGSATTMNWADAQSYCLSLGGDFRLPTLRELDSLVDLTVAAEPAIDNTVFPGAGPEAYWTSSPYEGRHPAGSAANVRYGDFSLHDSNACTASSQNWASVFDSLRVRCVR